MNRSAPRNRRVASTLVCVLPLVCVLARAPLAESADISPRVINGTVDPAYGRAAVAIETPDTYCTAGLWKPKVLVTAAHCVIVEGKKGLLARSCGFGVVGAFRR